MRLAYVSFMPTTTSEKRSVLAVHNTTTLSSECCALNARMSARSCSMFCFLLPVSTLSARLSWCDHPIHIHRTPRHVPPLNRILICQAYTAV